MAFFKTGGLRLLLLVMLLALMPRETKAWWCPGLNRSGWWNSPADNGYGNICFSANVPMGEDWGNNSAWDISADVTILITDASGNTRTYNVGKMNQLVDDWNRCNGTWIKEREWGSYANNSHHGYVSAYNLHYNSSSDEFWCEFRVVCDQHLLGDKNIKLEIHGDWIEDQKTRTRIGVALGPINCDYNISVKNLSAKRVNGKIEFNGTGSSISDYKYYLDLYSKGDLSGSYISTTGASTPNGLTVNVDNFQPYTYYPLVRQQRDNKDISYRRNITNKVLGKAQNVNAITVKGYPRAKGVEASTSDATQKKIIITWTPEYANANLVDSIGKWKIWRDCDGVRTFIGERPYGTRSIEDSNNLKYDKKYKYVVVFCPNGWTVNKESDANGLCSYSKEYEFKRNFTFSNLSITSTTANITFSWNHTSLTDASAEKQYTLSLERSMSAEAGAEWTLLKQYTIDSPSITDGKYVDSDPTLRLDETYYYRLSIYAQEATYYSDLNKGAQGLAGDSTITEFKA